MSSLPSGRPRRITRSTVSYVDPAPLLPEKTTSFTTGKKRGRKPKHGRQGKKSRNTAEENVIEEQNDPSPQDADAKVDDVVPPVEKRRRRLLPLPKGTQVEWNDVSRQYLGDTFPTLVANLPELLNPSYSREDVLAAVNSCIGKKLDEIKTINEHIKDAKAAARFLEQQVVESEGGTEREIKQEPIDENLPVTTEVIHAAPLVECALSRNVYAMFAYEECPEKWVLRTKTEPIDNFTKENEVLHGDQSSIQNARIPQTLCLSVPEMEESTTNNVEHLSNQSTVDQHEQRSNEVISESHGLSKVLPPDPLELPQRRYCRDSSLTERSIPQRLPHPPRQTPTFSPYSPTNSWRDDQRPIGDESRYGFRDRAPLSRRYPEVNYGQQFEPVPLYFHQQRRNGFPDENMYEPHGNYYRSPHRMDRSYTNRPVGRGRGGYAHRGRGNIRESNQERRYRDESWSRSPRH